MPKATATPSLYSHLIRELAKLTQGEGMSPRAIRLNAPTLMQITGTTRGVVAEEAVLQALGCLPRSRKTEALERALNYDGPFSTLTARRQELMSEWDVSEATLRRYEQAAIELLARELLGGSSFEEPPSQNSQSSQAALIDAINGLRRAVEDNTALLRKIHGC